MGPRVPSIDHSRALTMGHSPGDIKDKLAYKSLCHHPGSSGDILKRDICVPLAIRLLHKGPQGIGISPRISCWRKGQAKKSGASQRGLSSRKRLHTVLTTDQTALQDRRQPEYK